MILDCGLRPGEIGKSISRGKDFGLKIEDFREAAINSGAFGFILKKSMRDNLIQTIREAFESRDD